MLETRPVGRTHGLRLHEHLVLAARRRRAARGDAARRSATTPTFNVRGFECLGACDIAPMASVDGVVRRPDRRSTRCPSCSRSCAPARSRCPAKQLAPPARAPTPTPSERASMTDIASCFKDIDEPGLATLDVYGRRGGYDGAAQGAADARRPTSWSTSSRPPACAAAAAPASRWARRPRSCPRATWTSTSSATPTSPSRARSRTAS